MNFYCVKCKSNTDWNGCDDSYCLISSKNTSETITWIPITKGCEMPAHDDSVLITIWMDNSYGKGTDIDLAVDMGIYQDDGGYIDSANGIGGFDTTGDWDEGQPIKVVAWANEPKPYKGYDRD